MKLDKLTGQCSKFSIACIDTKSMDELMNASIIDQTDCEVWGITEREWCQAIEAAIEWKLLVELYSEGERT